MNANADRWVERISCQCCKSRKKPTFRAKRAPHCYSPNEKSECHCLCFRTHTHALFFHIIILMWTFVCRRFFFFVIESKLLDQKPHLFGLVVALAMFVIASNKKILFTIIVIAIIISRTSYIFDEQNTFHGFEIRIFDCVFVELTMSFFIIIILIVKGLCVIICVEKTFE